MAAFGALAGGGVPFGLDAGGISWRFVLARAVAATVAFVALTGGPGTALAQRVAAARPRLSAETTRAAALAAALGLGEAGIILATGSSTAAAAVYGLLFGLLVLLVRAAAVPPAGGADAGRVRRRAAVAGLSSAVTLPLLALPGGTVRMGLAYTATFGLLAATAALALLTRVDLPPVEDDAAGPRSPGRAALTAALAGAVVAASFVAGAGGASVMSANQLLVLLVAATAPTAALTFPAYAVVGCLGAAHLDWTRIVRPGRATRRTARDAVATGFFAAVVFAVIVGGGWTAALALLSTGLLAGPTTNDLRPFLFVGPGAALLAFVYWFLRAGGRGLLQQVTLRLLLWREGMLSWRAVELLEEATRLGLLRRAGSGHLFPHRLLMEHLAELPAAPGRELATTSTG